jgi:hypothetical protein
VRALALVLLLALAALAGCKDDTVLVTFRPEPGSTYTYESRVTATVSTRLEGGTPQRNTEEAVLRSRHTVLSSGSDGVRVQVELRRGSSPTRTFVVRFDRAAQLEEVESVEGIPAEALGALGLSEIFPAAAGAPPDRRLAPGDRWLINERVELPGIATPAELSGTGRLAELSVKDGRDLATLTSTVTLPLASSTSGRTAGAVIDLDGTQVSDNTVTYDLADGSVRELDAVTRGAFDIVVAPPAGSTGQDQRGRQSVEVRSETRRTG